VYSHTSDEQTTLESEKTTGKLGFYSLGLATNNYMYIAVGNPGFWKGGGRLEGLDAKCQFAAGWGVGDNASSAKLRYKA